MNTVKRENKGAIQMLKTMIDFYNSKAFTHRYIFGVQYKGSIYAVPTTCDILPYVLCIDSASRGQGKALKFKPNNEQRLMLIAQGAEVICSAKYFEELFNTTKYNRGEIFEKLITERFGMEWKKDNVSFTSAGDIEINKIPYQIKFEKASFINEKQMARLNG